MSYPGMDLVNVALNTAINSKEKEEWTPVTVNVASATLTIVTAEVSTHTDSHTHTISKIYIFLMSFQYEALRLFKLLWE